jgi:hypothetical protein
VCSGEFRVPSDDKNVPRYLGAEALGDWGTDGKVSITALAFMLVGKI